MTPLEAARQLAAVSAQYATTDVFLVHNLVAGTIARAVLEAPHASDCHTATVEHAKDCWFHTRRNDCPGCDCWKERPEP